MWDFPTHLLIFHWTSKNFYLSNFLSKSEVYLDNSYIFNKKNMNILLVKDAKLGCLKSLKHSLLETQSLSFMLHQLWASGVLSSLPVSKCLFSFSGPHIGWVGGVLSAAVCLLVVPQTRRRLQWKGYSVSRE